MAVEVKRHHYPSHAGYSHSVATRRLLSDQKGGYWQSLVPLFKRDSSLAPLDVAKITSLTTVQVSRFKDSHLPSPMPEEKTKNLIRRNQIRWHGFSQDELEGFAFVRKLIEAGLITEDITYWDKLNHFHKERQRPLPERFAEKLRSEVFLRAVDVTSRRDNDLFMTYQSIADSSSSLGDYARQMDMEEELILSRRRGESLVLEEDELKTLENWNENRFLILRNTLIGVNPKDTMRIDKQPPEIAMVVHLLMYTGAVIFNTTKDFNPMTRRIKVKDLLSLIDRVLKIGGNGHSLYDQMFALDQKGRVLT